MTAAAFLFGGEPIAESTRFRFDKGGKRTDPNYSRFGLWRGACYDQGPPPHPRGGDSQKHSITQ